MNSKDMKIISYLRQDARMSLTDVSKKTKMPVSTIFDRLRLNKNLIMKNTCLVDFSKFGYSSKANLILKITDSEKMDFRDYVANHESVNSVYQLEGGEFMVEGVFRNQEEYKRFISLLESRFTIITLQSHLIKEDIRREVFMTDPDMAIV